MLTFPNAKINIGLNIIEKRPDGFHNIESVFYPVNWCDALEIVPAKQFHFQSSGLSIPGDQHSNLCIKAYHLLRNSQPRMAHNGAHFHLHKVIPMGAGLGGGSADGAFALKILNEIFELELSNTDLQKYARQLGSDCAFFIENRPVFCFHKGDEFEEFSLNLTGKFIILVNPAIHISTAEAYAGVYPKKAEIPLKEALKLPLDKWGGVIKNDFEENLLWKYPTIGATKKTLYEQGALYASMTGSGSTVYGIFETEKDLKAQFPDFALWQGYLN
ncbi:4-(cytidine 5'-diphospho)-2-C-methyl-D-erythritol kinase [Emticicia sp. BO119]|uniref:4-(cytidine 5'-diphospho)-2-C-methyl-D-erythritol kinase n=1 Tax=Emticicia sp. BO119 TaxID=2757768 RepID=UPI0015F0DEAD|nr:4-(cytidine 5'-diphospho)-2-C-methyl-D-erythritol kinase [Emticicia sp. BO119]MBA4852962.1 4-(cytidine 5'-diphospho)-2-C-methyl-D-erythritol kinase [Emticicia sp. BO119]